ncbi:hypothetical protein PUN4_830053 [Paraburkholderia unamae]|nr:hypothetical protein PUN4_830053 [Paraburkholderia unamae]
MLAPLQLPVTALRHRVFRIMKSHFTGVIERPKVLNCLQLSLTIARIYLVGDAVSAL